jgi:diguanylate cyclase (GGDEF)-like protein
VVNDKWLDASVIKENPFNKRVTDVRRATQVNMEAMAAVEYLRSGDGGQTGAHQIVQHQQQNAHQSLHGSPHQSIQQSPQRISGTFNTESGFASRTPPPHGQSGVFNNDSGFASRTPPPHGQSGVFNNDSGFASRTPPSYSQSGVFQRADVIVRELTEDEIDQKAFYDTTTEAYNLRYVLRTLHSELLRAQTFNRPVSILVVAVNNFKNLGLDYGALALDSIASTAATTLLTTCRAVDIVGRFMEDRFIVVLPETDLRSASVIAENMRVAFDQIAIPHQWHTIRFQANIGLATFPGNGNDVESFISLADYASDSVAGRGGNGVLLAPTA